MLFSPLIGQTRILQCSLQMFSAREAFGRFFCEAPQDDLFKISWDVRAKVVQANNRIEHVRRHCLYGGGAHERWLTHKEKVCHRAKAVNVAAGVQVLPADCLFW